MASVASMASPTCMRRRLWSPTTSSPLRTKTRNSPKTSLRISNSPKTSLRISASNLPDASALLEAAHHAVDSNVKSGMVVGLGSGKASEMAIQYLGRQLRTGALKGIIGIPMTVASASEAAKAGIPLDNYEENSHIDFAFDDADVIEEGTLTAIIGRQVSQAAESLIREKCILKTADNVAFIVSKSQYRSVFDGSIPVLIRSINWLATAEEIDDLFLGDAEVWRRSAVGFAADPLGGDFPLITKEGHNVLDLIFTSPISSLAEVAKSLDKIDGVVSHGVVSKIPCTAVIASESGLSIVDNLSKNAVE